MINQGSILPLSHDVFEASQVSTSCLSFSNSSAGHVGDSSQVGGGNAEIMRGTGCLPAPGACTYALRQTVASLTMYWYLRWCSRMMRGTCCSDIFSNPRLSIFNCNCSLPLQCFNVATCRKCSFSRFPEDCREQRLVDAQNDGWKFLWKFMMKFC